MSVQPLLGLRAACILVVLVVAVIWIPAASAFFPELPPTIHARAEADAPNGYAPASIPCPTPRPAVRAATDISPEERAWLDLREKNTVSALRTVLTRADIAGLDIDSYMDMFANDTNLAPRVGIALSGGGYRALLNGAGALAAFDDRSSNSTGQGQLGGLLQAATYLSGLSGGSWTVGSLYTQNFTTVESIVEATSGFLSSLWRLDESIFEGPQSISVSRYYRELHDSVKAKVDAGFNKTITDYWGRALSYQLVNATDGGPGAHHHLTKAASKHWILGADC
jgi:lysophospholipase